MEFGQIGWLALILAAYLTITISLNFLKARSTKNTVSQKTADSHVQPLDSAHSAKVPSVTEHKMHAVDIGCGENVSYPTGGRYITRQIEWRSIPNSDESSPTIRTPQPKKKEYHAVGGFHAAGKWYAGMHQLRHKQTDDPSRCIDVHGREVICVSERFPCFDSYDYLHENRYFSWFILRENDQFTRIYHADETVMIYITEDVKNIETGCADKLKELGYLK